MTTRRLMRCLAALLLTVFCLRAAQHLVSHDYNEAFEGICLNASLEFADGHALYPARDAHPRFVYVHSPLGSVVGGLAAKLVPGTQARPKILAIRLVSLIALFAALAILWRGVTVPLGVPFAAFATVTLFALPKFTDYATTGRNDMLSMLAEVATLAAFLAWKRSHGFWRLSLFAASALVSVYTRQMGIVVAGAALLSLLVERQWRNAVLATLMMVLPALALYGLLNHLTRGAFYQHLIAYNIRPYSPIFARDSILFLPTTLGVFACYALFTTLGIIGYRATSGWPLVMRLAPLLSLAMSAMLFFRPGGDVNYFFEPILLALPFAAFAWERLRASRWLLLAATAQALVITAFIGLRMVNSYQRTFYPYESVAEAIRHDFPSRGLVVGRQADGLAVHLRGWAMHGPDVTAGAPVAYYCLPQTRWIFEELKTSFETGQWNTMVSAEPGCSRAPYPFSFPNEVGAPPMDWKLAKSFDDQVCVYTR